MMLVIMMLDAHPPLQIEAARHTRRCCHSPPASGPGLLYNSDDGDHHHWESRCLREFLGVPSRIPLGDPLKVTLGVRLESLWEFHGGSLLRFHWGPK